MTDVVAGLAFDLSMPELITFAAVLLGCLAWAPFVARHWRGTYARIEVGLESLPFAIAQRTKDRMMATYHFVVIGVGSMAAAALLDTARPRIPVLPELLGGVFFACILLFVTAWFFGRPAWMVPPRYRNRSSQ